MPDSVVQTKLRVPRPRARAVARPRLDELIRAGADARLTLVSAPAGFGKTTLLSTWFGAGGRPTAWVSLDERDRDPSSFWTYVLLAVDRAAPGTATAALAQVQSGQLQSGQVAIETVLTSLLNELSVLPGDLTLVLDDYHLAEGPDIQPGVAFLLDHLPPQVHLAISTRADPALPLSRLRARGQVVEVRAADLRFTAAETDAYLNEVSSLGLEPAAVTALESRTEGWAAALQLAALSLQGRDDPGPFIAGFTGDDRYVVDYLADEVLDRQSDDVRRFLLETSVLERLTGPLCDAVTGRTDGRAMLEALERQNLFLIPLDANRRWYRYHHLFADVLRARLLDDRPGDVAALHRRASNWFDRSGHPEAAVRHALAAGDTVLAADLVELAIPSMLRERRESVVRRWVGQLPADVIRNRPVLAVGFIGALMSSNAFDGVEQRLRDVEHLLDAPADDQIVLDQAEFSRLPAAVQTYRAALALVHGDLPGTVQHASAALARAAEADHLTIAAASALLGLASWTNGDLDAAHEAYKAAAESLQRAGHVADVLGCSITIADIEMTQGRLGEAERTFQYALELAGHAPDRLRGEPDMYVGLSRVARERGDLSYSGECLRKADELGELAGLPQNPYRWRVALALLRAAQGDPQHAVALLEDAERVYVADFAPNVRPVAATRARLLATAGDVTGALEWAARQGLSVTDDLSYLHEYEHVTLARILLAGHATAGGEQSLADATTLLDRLLHAAETAGRTGTVIELLVLRARALAAAGKQHQALVSLERAVRLAEPDGYVQVFADDGSPLAGPLHALAGRHRHWAFLGRLAAAAAASGTEVLGTTSAGAPSGHSVGPRPGGQADQLVDPLSNRELNVLRFLGSDLSGPDIARELGVSLSTVRTHTQHIYTKLDVNNRRAAVRRAHQLNLFDRGARR
jgi:LuxR family maltose regulon positive regulatory protein